MIALGLVAANHGAAHRAFLVYLPVGGFLALRWRRTIGAHMAAVLWALGSVLAHWPCPLTGLEQWARPRAGMAPLGPAGFIDHYLTAGHPGGPDVYLQSAALLAVLASWAAYLLTGRGRGIDTRNIVPE